MRLLHSIELRFEEFFDSSIPRYAILSHRWDSHEVSFQVLQETLSQLNNEQSRRTSPWSGERFAKIRRFRELAARDGYKWIWIDTCCINKDSSAELSEAINSMFRWYQNSHRCYVYLEDVDCPTLGTSGHGETERAQLRATFRKTEWLKRGWTLQELLAPAILHFYDRGWRWMGEREAWANEITQSTGIEVELLDRYNVTDLLSPRLRHHDHVRRHNISSKCVAKKLSWLSTRTTSRTEDMAYCMLGLLDVNMPLLYGEGRKAFLRLQLEFISKSDDESIFAWEVLRIPAEARDSESFEGSIRRGLLAPYPSCFAKSDSVTLSAYDFKPIPRLPYAMTNQGLEFRIKTDPATLDKKSIILVELNCYSKSTQERICLSLDKRWSLHGDSYWWERMDCFTSDQPTLEFISDKTSAVSLYIRQPKL